MLQLDNVQHPSGQEKVDKKLTDTHLVHPDESMAEQVQQDLSCADNGVCTLVNSIPEVLRELVGVTGATEL